MKASKPYKPSKADFIKMVDDFITTEECYVHPKELKDLIHVPREITMCGVADTYSGVFMFRGDNAND